MGTHRFTGGREFDPASGELSRDGTVVRLEPQPAAVLAILAARAGQVVAHDEIRRAVWGDNTHVNFRESVHYCIRQIRAALGESARATGIVETIPRRGYRLRSDAIVAVATASKGPPGSGRSVPRRLLFGGAVVVAGLTTLIVERGPNNHHEIAVSVLRTLHDFVF